MLRKVILLVLSCLYFVVSFMGLLVLCRLMKLIFLMICLFLMFRYGMICIVIVMILGYWVVYFFCQWVYELVFFVVYGDNFMLYGIYYLMISVGQIFFNFGMGNLFSQIVYLMYLVYKIISIYVVEYGVQIGIGSLCIVGFGKINVEILGMFNVVVMFEQINFGLDCMQL